MIRGREATFMKRKHNTFEARSSKEEGSYNCDGGGGASAGVSLLLSPGIAEWGIGKSNGSCAWFLHWEKKGKADFMSVLKEVDVEEKMSGQSGYNCSQPNEPRWKCKKTWSPLSLFFPEVSEKV